MFDLPDLPDSHLQPITIDCVQKISVNYQIHVDILWAILLVEQGTVGKEKLHQNGNTDIGPAQINATHLPELEKKGISREQLRDNGCVNLEFAATYLRRVTKGKTHTANDPESYLKLIARYHNKDEPHNTIYANKLKGAFMLLYENESSSERNPGK